MISSLVNVSIVIVESLGSEALVYYLEIIIQFLDLLSIPPLILIFNFGKNKWMDFIEIICCKDKPSTIFMEQAKKDQWMSPTIIRIINHTTFLLMPNNLIINNKYKLIIN